MKTQINKPAKQILDLMKKTGCRQVTFNQDPTTGMCAILAIDSIGDKRDAHGRLSIISTSGGTRFAHKDEDIALEDAMKLAKAMTRKCKVLGVNEGGAKAVVIANQPKTKKLLLSIGDFIQIQKGLFKTAVDVGLGLDDASIIASRTKFIDSLSCSHNGLGSTGENTAEGIINGFEVISKKILKKPLKECSIAIQGLGAVGMPLAQKLINKNCKVIATDIDKKLCSIAKKIGVVIVNPKEIFSQKVDIFAPCALGGVLDKKTIPELKCKVVAGGANNPLKDERKGEKQLLERGIIFIPDFVLNCAGFLQALVERNGGTVEEARKKSKIVGERISEIIDFSEKNNCTLLESSIKLFGGKNGPK